MDVAARWLGHTQGMDPADFSAAIGRLQGDVSSLCTIVQNLLIHGDCLAMYGIDAGALAPVDRTTLPVRERLGRLAGGRGDLRAALRPEERQVGTCRDFALLLCSFLRVHRVPARVRCGFASYFGDTWWDHWICEYRDVEADGWLRADAELDGVMRDACGIGFDPTRMPPGAFLTAGEAWIACRAELLSFADFGHGENRGPWFAGVNVVRDALSVNGRETSPRDRWRETPVDLRRVSADAEVRLDDLARHPERPVQDADLLSLLA